MRDFMVGGLVILTVACAQERDDADLQPTGIVPGPGDTDPTPESDTETGGEDPSDTDGKLDVPEPQMPAADGCHAADLLFVIDNSGSMCDAQEGLASTLPGLVDAMFDSLPPHTDLHVGIVTTSFSQGGSHQEIGCAAAEGPATIDAAYVLDEHVSGNGFQGRLFEYDGLRYFEADTGNEADRDPLKQWFSNAVVSVGCDGGAYEFPSAAAAYAVDPSNAETNIGFVRDEGSALAIFVLTNEVDQSRESLDRYRDMVLDAKAECGGVECIVTAGLLAPNCVPDSNPFIWQFLSAFGGPPVWGDINDFASYDDVVSSALADAVAQTCEDIDPVG